MLRLTKLARLSSVITSCRFVEASLFLRYPLKRMYKKGLILIMRSDFSNQNNSSKPKKSSRWDRRRIIRALFFVVIGLMIGFWLHNKNKSNPPPTTAQVQAPKPPTQVVEEVDLPSNRLTWYGFRWAFFVIGLLFAKLIGIHESYTVIVKHGYHCMLRVPVP